MKLKEIYPGMAIHCTRREQVQYLVDIGISKESFTKFGVPIWICVIGKGICSWMPEVDTDGTKGKDYYEKDGRHCVEFSDLIIPEMSAEEAVEWLGEHYNDGTFEQVFGFDLSMSNLVKSFAPHEIIEKIAKWKSEHEKKESEIETEWFWQGKILQDIEGVGYCQFKNGLGIYDTGCEYQESAEEYMNDILKEYCKNHKGKFVAVVEHVCRVKK